MWFYLHFQFFDFNEKLYFCTIIWMKDQKEKQCIFNFRSHHWFTKDADNSDCDCMGPSCYAAPFEVKNKYMFVNSRMYLTLVKLLSLQFDYKKLPNDNECQRDVNQLNPQYMNCIVLYWTGTVFC